MLAIKLIFIVVLAQLVYCDTQVDVPVGITNVGVVKTTDGDTSNKKVDVNVLGGLIQVSN